MESDSTVRYVLLFGHATGVLPFPMGQWSHCKRPKFYYRLGKIYAMFMLILNAACNLDANLTSTSSNVDLAMRLYTVAIYYVGCFADYWIHLFVLVRYRRISTLLRRVCFIQKYTSRLCAQSIESADGRC